ncbi:hypothetical protein D3C80_1094120 [compost metagenome]
MALGRVRVSSSKMFSMTWCSLAARVPDWAPAWVMAMMSSGVTLSSRCLGSLSRVITPLTIHE